MRRGAAELRDAIFLEDALKITEKRIRIRISLVRKRVRIAEKKTANIFSVVSIGDPDKNWFAAQRLIATTLRFTEGFSINVLLLFSR